MKSTRKDRSTKRFGVMSVFYFSQPEKKTYRKAFAITHAQENEQRTNLKVRINELAITPVERSIFSKLTAPRSVKLPP